MLGIGSGIKCKLDPSRSLGVLQAILKASAGHESDTGHGPLRRQPSESLLLERHNPIGGWRFAVGYPNIVKTATFPFGTYLRQEWRPAKLTL